MKLLITLLLISALFLVGCSIPFLSNNNSGNKTNVNNTNTNTTVDQKNRTTIIIKNDSGRDKIDNDTVNPRLPDNASPRITPGYTSTPGERFAVYFINVGKDELQGDAILIKKETSLLF